MEEFRKVYETKPESGDGLTFTMRSIKLSDFFRNFAELLDNPEAQNRLITGNVIVQAGEVQSGDYSAEEYLMRAIQMLRLIRVHAGYDPQENKELGR